MGGMGTRLYCKGRPGYEAVLQGEAWVRGCTARGGLGTRLYNKAGVKAWE